LGSLRSTN